MKIRYKIIIPLVVIVVAVASFFIFFEIMFSLEDSCGIELTIRENQSNNALNISEEILVQFPHLQSAIEQINSSSLDSVLVKTPREEFNRLHSLIDTYDCLVYNGRYYTIQLITT